VVDLGDQLKYLGQHIRRDAKTIVRIPPAPVKPNVQGTMRHCASGRGRSYRAKRNNLDDLMSFSSMTLEETREATAALLALIEQADSKHTASLRQVCA
jgi:hypothetical protein